jgi:hypothetical protein
LLHKLSVAALLHGQTTVAVPLLAGQNVAMLLLARQSVATPLLAGQSVQMLLLLDKTFKRCCWPDKTLQCMLCGWHGMCI